VGVWICDAVVVPSKPLNDTSTNNVFATSSVVTVAKPVPGDAFGGDSPGPVRLAVVGPTERGPDHLTGRGLIEHKATINYSPDG